MIKLSERHNQSCYYGGVQSTTANYRKATQKGVSHREFSYWKWNQKFINLSFLQTVNSLRYHAMHIKFHNIQYSFEIHTQVVHGDDGGNWL